MRGLLVALLATAGLGCASDAGGRASLIDRSSFGAWIKVDAGGSRFAADRAGAVAPVDGTGQFGVGARAFAGPTIGWVGGVDAHLGASVPAGALYDLNLSPLGLGIYGHGVLLGAMGGVGVGGIIGRVPVGFQVPVEAMLDVDLGTHVHAGAWASVRWVVGAPSRDDGPAHAPFGDELSSGVMLRIGRGIVDPGLRWGYGVFVAGTYAEAMGGHAWGGLLGYSITMAGSQR
jgi:hypothetical protein